MPYPPPLHDALAHGRDLARHGRALADRLLDRALPPGRPRRLTLLALALALHFGHPLALGQLLPGWWFPPVAVGFVLIAWFGPRAALVLAADTLLVHLQAWLTGMEVPWTRPVTAALWQAAVVALEALAAWGVYRGIARGSRRLSDPRSATAFLLLVPGAVAALFAPLNALPQELGPGPGAVGFLALASRYWLSHALAFMALAPLLLITLTPRLVRLGLARPDPSPLPEDGESPTGFSVAQQVEVTALATGTALLGLVSAAGYILFLASKSPDPDFRVRVDLPTLFELSHLSGLPLIVIVLASLRNGLRGGVLVAGSAVLAQLAVLIPLLRVGPPNGFYQAGLLIQSGTALLLVAAAHWTRRSEALFRQVVSRVPVVLYSARLNVPPTPDAVDADVTFVSPAAHALFAAEPEQLLGPYDHWLAAVHPGDRPFLRDAVARMRRTRQPVTCEYRLAGPAVPTAVGERPRTVRDTLAPLFGPAGELQGWDGVVSDITLPRALADDLRRTTTMFQAVITHLPAGVFFVQGERGRPILVNDRARQLLGRPEDPDAGLDQLAAVYGLRRAGQPYPTDELPVVRALRQGLTTMRDDIVVRRPDGTELPLIAWAAPVQLAAAGEPDAAVWVFEDLSAQRRAEAARRESEARLRAIIETMAEGVMVLDAPGRVAEANPAAGTILGQAAAGLAGRDLREPSWRWARADGTPCPPAEHPAAVSLATGEPVRNVTLGLPGGTAGETRWLLVSAMPLAGARDDGPAARRAVMTFADITDAREALATVRASEERYRGLVETLPILLVQFDLRGAVTYMNPAARTLTGYGPGDLTSAAATRDLVRPEDRPRFDEALAGVARGKTTQGEIRFRARDGAEKVGFTIVEPRRQAGRVVGATALTVDMTRERQLEGELQRVQRMDLVGRLASGLTHDFNNLLTVILALAQAAQDGLPEDHPVRQDLRRIAYAGEQAANLSHQIVAFSRNRKAQPRRVDVNKVAGRAVELLRATLPRRLKVEADFEGDELPVQADEMQIQQVLMNLGLNARDAMHGAGRLTLRTRRAPRLPTPSPETTSSAPPVVRLDGAGPARPHPPDGGPAAPGAEGWVCLSVEDTGSGIPPEVLGRIFEPFYTTKEHGTGLGLAMVCQIVESFGGRVDVTSRPGHGSRFDVWLPATAAPAARSVAARGA